MCVHSRREYTVGNAAAAGAFAAAAVLGVLRAADWSVAQQADIAVTELLTGLRHTAAADTPVGVEVTVHANSVEIMVASEAPGWPSESVRLRPRHSFETAVECTIEAREPALARPPIWPELAAAPGYEDWSDVYTALGAIMRNGHGGRNALAPTLDAIADAVVVTTCFSLVVINLVRPDGDLEVVSVSGSTDARRALLGTIEARRHWDELIHDSVAWGTLRFAPGDAPLPSSTVMNSWTPPTIDSAAADGWNADDALLAPLYSAGRLVGAMSVDLPGGASRPTVEDLRKLELFAEHTGGALDHARSPYLLWTARG